MSLANAAPLTALDGPTLSFVAICVAAMLGFSLLFTWLQQPDVRALGWWGAAYLIGALSIGLWSAPTRLFSVPPDLPAALIFIACGMIWNGVRLFQGRRLLPVAASTGAIVWLVACQLPAFPAGSNARTALGVIIIASYTFCIAFELGRERRKSLDSRTAAILVPCLHASIFLLPLAMHAFLPGKAASGWLSIFALETLIYGIGTAFIVLMMVQDRQVLIYRDAATTDFLTGVLNRRAFREGARWLCNHGPVSGGPITLLMFDLDRFKQINDRFGHALGDEVLCVFAQAMRSSMRATDIVARVGGEEFAAIIPASLESAAKIAERVRTTFEATGVIIAGEAVEATVSIGVATSREPVTDIDFLMSRADAALYTAKKLGRNRVCSVEIGLRDIEEWNPIARGIQERIRFLGEGERGGDDAPLSAWQRELGLSGSSVNGSGIKS